MKVVMVSPNSKKEKAIANYSINLIENIRKAGVDIDKVTYTAGRLSSLFKLLPKISQYDIIHLQHEYNLLGRYGLPFFVVLFYLGIMKKGKLIVTMHTVLSQKERFREVRIRTFLRKILYFTQNRIINWVSDNVIVHANFFKDLLVSEYNFSAERLTVFPQGIIENLKKISKEKAKKELGLLGSVYLLTGNFVPDHGADIIIRQSKKIGKTILIVASIKAVNDRNEERIKSWLKFNEDYVKQHKLNRFIRFDIKEEAIPRALWWKYFSAADLILLPYKGGIGSGIFADAISARKPMVASNIKFFKEAAREFSFIKIAEKEEDYSKVIKEVKKSIFSKKIKEDFDRYFREYGLFNLGVKYKKLYFSLI